MAQSQIAYSKSSPVDYEERPDGMISPVSGKEENSLFGGRFIFPNEPSIQNISSHLSSKSAVVSDKSLSSISEKLVDFFSEECKISCLYERGVRFRYLEEPPVPIIDPLFESDKPLSSISKKLPDFFSEECKIIDLSLATSILQETPFKFSKLLSSHTNTDSDFTPTSLTKCVASLCKLGWLQAQEEFFHRTEFFSKYFSKHSNLYLHPNEVLVDLSFDWDSTQQSEYLRAILWAWNELKALSDLDVLRSVNAKKDGFVSTNEDGQVSLLMAAYSVGAVIYSVGKWEPTPYLGWLLNSPKSVIAKHSQRKPSSDS